MIDADKIFQLLSGILLLTAIVTLVMAVVAWRRSADRHANWLKTNGEVIEVEDDDRDGSIYKVPVIAFQDSHGARHIFKSDFTRTNWDISTGDILPIIYDGANPQAAEVKGLLSQWLLPVALGTASILSLLLIPIIYYLIHLL